MILVIHAAHAANTDRLLYDPVGLGRRPAADFGLFGVELHGTVFIEHISRAARSDSDKTFGWRTTLKFKCQKRGGRRHPFQTCM